MSSVDVVREMVGVQSACVLLRAGLSPGTITTSLVELFDLTITEATKVLAMAETLEALDWPTPSPLRHAH